jgi:signal peptide peptidase SppA
VNIVGAITDRVALETVASLRKIKKDPKIKAVVLRIDSPGGCSVAAENVLQECKDIPQPIICSMGNTCASGGYYIATGCKRIFASPTTITGSIGAFIIKFDLTGMAKKYGFNVEQIKTGPYSASSHPFSPLNPFVKANLAQRADRIYENFKSVVSESRGIELDEVEDLAQGRIWTGGEAKRNGLVDELGGFDRAIAYARREFSSGEAVIELWPKAESPLDFLKRRLMSEFLGMKNHVPGGKMEDYDSFQYLIRSILEDPTKAKAMDCSQVFLTLDEKSAFQMLVNESANNLEKPLIHTSIWK